MTVTNFSVVNLSNDCNAIVFRKNLDNFPFLTFAGQLAALNPFV